MKGKLLPLPLGGAAPSGSRVRFWQQFEFRGRLDGMMAAGGVALAVAGAWMGLHPAKLTVFVDRTGYHIGGTLLPQSRPGIYGGDAAVAVRQVDGQLRAAAAGKLSGTPMQGLCIFVLGTDTEQCIFVVGKTSFHSEDRLQGDHWLRRYDDGHQVEIQMTDPAHPVPVPIPVGWR